MNATFTCAICGEKMRTTKDGRIPEYCPFCGAHKKMTRSKRSDRLPVEQRLALYDEKRAHYDEVYREFCLARRELTLAWYALRSLNQSGKLPDDKFPSLPLVKIARDGRYFAEIAGKDVQK